MNTSLFSKERSRKVVSESGCRVGTRFRGSVSNQPQAFASSEIVERGLGEESHAALSDHQDVISYAVELWLEIDA